MENKSRFLFVKTMKILTEPSQVKKIKRRMRYKKFILNNIGSFAIDLKLFKS